MDNGDDPLHFTTGRSRALSESVVASALLGSIILKYMGVKMEEALDTSHKKTVFDLLALHRHRHIRGHDERGRLWFGGLGVRRSEGARATRGRPTCFETRRRRVRHGGGRCDEGLCPDGKFMRASDTVLGPLLWMSQEDSAFTLDLRLLSCDLRLRCKFVACLAAEMMSMTWCKDDASVAASEPSLFDASGAAREHHLQRAPRRSGEMVDRKASAMTHDEDDGRTHGFGRRQLRERHLRSQVSTDVFWVRGW